MSHKFGVFLSLPKGLAHSVSRHTLSRAASDPPGDWRLATGDWRLATGDNLAEELRYINFALEHRSFDLNSGEHEARPSFVVRKDAKLNFRGAKISDLVRYVDTLKTYFATLDSPALSLQGSTRESSAFAATFDNSHIGK